MKTSFFGSLLGIATLLGPPAPRFSPAEGPAVPRVTATLPTAGRNIRQRAFDGDEATYFASEGEAGPDDSLTLSLGEPTRVRAISVLSGREDGGDRLDSGSLEVSADGQTFENVAKFAEGKAEAKALDRPVVAIRVRPGDGPRHPLVVREIKIEADRPVPPFAYPVEIAVDVADAPELRGWADRVAEECERWYPRINEALKSEDFTPRQQITLRLKKDYRGVAAAGGGRITGSVKYFTDHPDDEGAMIHETTHIVQSYRGRGNPGWLVEGVADYVRFFLYEPGTAIRPDPEKAHYDDSYRTSAAFLAFVAEKYNKDLVRKLNRLMRRGEYRDDAFREFTGKTLDELDEEWRASLKR